MVFIAHRGHHLVGGHAQCFHGRRLQVEVDFASGAAHQRDRAHATHILQPLFEHLLGPVGDLHCRQGAAAAGGCLRHHGQRPDGAAGGVKAQHLGLFDLGAQQRAHRSDLLAHVLGRLAAVHVQLKFDDHHRLVFVAARGQGVDAGDRVDRFFDFFRDFALDNFRGGARVLGADHHDREVDVGELVDLQALKGKQAQHHQRQHQHGGEDRVFQADACEPHGDRALSAQPL